MNYSIKNIGSRFLHCSSCLFYAKQIFFCRFNGLSSHKYSKNWTFGRHYRKVLRIYLFLLCTIFLWQRFGAPFPMCCIFETNFKNYFTTIFKICSASNSWKKNLNAPYRISKILVILFLKWILQTLVKFPFI